MAIRTRAARRAGERPGASIVHALEELVDREAEGDERGRVLTASTQIGAVPRPTQARDGRSSGAARSA